MGFWSGCGLYGVFVAGPIAWICWFGLCCGLLVIDWVCTFMFSLGGWVSVVLCGCCGDFLLGLRLGFGLWYELCSFCVGLYMQFCFDLAGCLWVWLCFVVECVAVGFVSVLLVCDFMILMDMYSNSMIYYIWICVVITLWDDDLVMVLLQLWCWAAVACFFDCGIYGVVDVLCYALVLVLLWVIVLWGQCI